jgi:hypothetical protein
MVDVMLMAAGLAILYVTAVITLMIDKESNPKHRAKMQAQAAPASKPSSN